MIFASHKKNASKQDGKKAPAAVSPTYSVRRPREDLQYSAVIMYCAAVGVHDSRVVAATEGVLSLTRSPELPDTAAASSVPKQQFAHQNVPANYCADYPSVHVFSKISRNTSIGRGHS